MCFGINPEAKAKILLKVLMEASVNMASMAVLFFVGKKQWKVAKSEVQKPEASVA